MGGVGVLVDDGGAIGEEDPSGVTVAETEAAERVGGVVDLEGDEPPAGTVVPLATRKRLALLSASTQRDGRRRRVDVGRA